jgi:hypothetical protein
MEHAALTNALTVFPIWAMFAWHTFLIWLTGYIAVRGFLWFSRRGR